MTNTIKISCNIRLPKENKTYYLGLMQRFADCFDANKVLSVAFGKQDIRGTESITLFDHRHCVPRQLHFANKHELLGYLKGFCDAGDTKKSYGQWSSFITKKMA